MSGYLLTIFILWMLIYFTQRKYNLVLFNSLPITKFIVIILCIFVIPGFITDLIAIEFEWYIFPESSTYLWMTSLGIPVEEILFFITVPIWILILWKLSLKVVSQSK